MEAFDRRIKKSLITKAITICVTVALLLCFELMLAGANVAMQQAPPVVCVAILLMVVNGLSSMAYKWIMKDGGRRAIGFYLIDKVVRFFLVIVIVLIYALADRRNLLAFAINLLVLYVADAVTSMMLYVSTEQNFNKKK
uniref:hypothetical protein n=1 Tax=Alloprevotella sp. TaxID=1872471 RepID=UPI003FEF7800